MSAPDLTCTRCGTIPERAGNACGAYTCRVCEVCEHLPVTCDAPASWLEIDTAVSRAEDAFFAAVARTFRDLPTGDLDPMAAALFSQAAREVVLSWLEANAGVNR